PPQQFHSQQQQVYPPQQFHSQQQQVYPPQQFHSQQQQVYPPQQFHSQQQQVYPPQQQVYPQHRPNSQPPTPQPGPLSVSASKSPELAEQQKMFLAGERPISGQFKIGGRGGNTWRLAVPLQVSDVANYMKTTTNPNADDCVAQLSSKGKFSFITRLSDEEHEKEVYDPRSKDSANEALSEAVQKIMDDYRKLGLPVR
ncbi:hypothetical protein ACFQUU_28255, partial [Herbaspirillum sp. GCM10030257]|uniref:hypothetical protein n=1 Tax=Herbaspirillum sp. GCM10030257 TaxID=3273393 RepID=UPI003620481F